MAVKRDSKIAMAIAATVESTINHALEFDPASKQAVSKLTDILAIEVTSARVPAINLFCRGVPRGINITSRCESSITTRLTGSTAALIGLLNRPHNLANSGVNMTGDVVLLQRWQAVLNNLDIDWQTCLQDHLGDIVGPVVGGFIDKTGLWLQHQWRHHQHQLGIYLQEELRVMPTKSECDNFYQQVDELVLATDRLQARIAHLHSTDLTDPDPKISDVEMAGLKSTYVKSTDLESTDLESTPLKSTNKNKSAK